LYCSWNKRRLALSNVAKETGNLEFSIIITT